MKFRRLGRMVKPLVNFPRWMGLSQILAQARIIAGLFKDFRSYPTEQVRKETFAEAMQRLNLTEQDIQARMKQCLWLSIIYTLVALVFLVYAIYLIMHGLLGSFILALLLTALMTTFAYQQSFWYYQIKTQQLGVSFKVWLKFLLRGPWR
jgi:intracellular multiplication protein IcmV